MPLAPPAQRRDAAVLFRAHASFVANFLRRLGVPPLEIDDLVQEIFLVAHRRGGFMDEGRAKPTTWLAEISIRVASSRRRKRRRSREDPDGGRVSDALPSHDCPARHAENQEALARVHEALAQLDEDRRAIFILFEIEGEACGAIAEAFQIPIGTVYSRLHSARAQFRRAHDRLSLAAAPVLRPRITP